MSNIEQTNKWKCLLETSFTMKNFIFLNVLFIKQCDNKQNKTNMLFDLIVYKMTDEWFIE